MVHGEEETLTTPLRNYACEPTPDMATAQRNLKLSDNNRKVTAVNEEQPYPDHPGRFEHWKQLLCRNGLTGRCYWEVECEGNVYIALTYRGISRREARDHRGISRKGARDHCRFGRNNQSWSLFCSDYDYAFWHNNMKTVIPPPPSCSASKRVAVYLDYPAGTLSFYRVCTHRLTHLHTFRTTFTEPLYPGFGFRSGSSVSLCSL
ncbi:stonustoxin subunit beta-like [Mastacembelus armatus]|nr:stonustoxin subunit beta-like [Mastacembelus armatus]